MNSHAASLLYQTSVYFIAIVSSEECQRCCVSEMLREIHTRSQRNVSCHTSVVSDRSAGRISAMTQY